MKSSSQIPKDGYGQEKTLYGHAMRLKAKDLSATRSTTLKITGMTSGAVHYIDVLVRNGEPARFSPPASTPSTVPRTTVRSETTFRGPERQEQRQEQGQRQEQRQRQEQGQRQEQEERQEQRRGSGREQERGTTR